MPMRRSAVVFVILSVGCSAPAAPATDAGAGDAAGAAGSGFALDAGPVVEACSPTDAAPDVHVEASTCTPSRQDVQFARDVRPILLGCGGEICHSNQWAGANPWPAMVSQPALECCDGREIVEPGNPDGSYLLQKVEDHDLCGGQRMPLGQAPLSPAQLQTLYDWICLGALDN